MSKKRRERRRKKYLAARTYGFNSKESSVLKDRHSDILKKAIEIRLRYNQEIAKLLRGKYNENT